MTGKEARELSIRFLEEAEMTETRVEQGILIQLAHPEITFCPLHFSLITVLTRDPTSKKNMVIKTFLDKNYPAETREIGLIVPDQPGMIELCFTQGKKRRFFLRGLYNPPWLNQSGEV